MKAAFPHSYPHFRRANAWFGIPIFVFALVGVAVLVGCQQGGAQKPTPTWQRFFPGNDKLVGVRVQQYPDNDEDHDRYAGKHPAMVEYVFRRDGKYEVCQVGFTPVGDIEELFWWKSSPDKWDLEGLQPLPKR